MPSWDRKKLVSHHRKRTVKDAGCFEDLLGINGRLMTVTEYEKRSDQAYEQSWLEYEAEKGHTDDDDYYPRCAYFVDDELIVAITNTKRSHYVTCFHEHFDRPHGLDPGRSADVGTRRLRYRDSLEMEERCGMIRKVRRIRGG